MLYSANPISTTTTLSDYQEIVYQDTEPMDKREYDDLKEKYDGDDFIYERTIEQSGWWTRFKKWLSDFFKDLFDFQSDAEASDAVSSFINIFFIILFVLVVFFIAKAIINREGNWVFGKSSDKNIIPVTDVETNIHATDFKTLIKNAENDNNFRLAVRYYYLWLLKTLSEVELIDYDVEKTNSDYYLELENETIRNEFSYTSYLYNYIWYGEFNIDAEQFDKAKNAYNQFLRSLWK
ncbi:DUF4129 domain-containing protein [Psychroserpens sp.]|uniref:DUF4129 domain-containing protein n=1 Tax=Psychroserpens sp. TaxID=2020870 RepID=UPI001B20DD13|nr:DUF4129 domain-containing protein [Psychroserpens sp.]MBO6607122.1 DUF4129 domain-containing protein [Psychroserpens sp.]MBO6630393.1 DUF4129 domain-containing protein [Psychroserpens sp.]MBO6654268.1 DUF4129 domain-containing protein [Psychroserpens sp.]MBO6682446.1 DUF4129 domain-containing protein [Psychroserpens sp.]MBO6915677.1 DUF4129 domain-containing protein [Psychroserpens sp.]